MSTTRLIGVGGLMGVAIVKLIEDVQEGPSRSFGETNGALPHGRPYIAHPMR
ncbi:MAG TPA: hypothetical protein VF051_09910 [Hyphomicrobiaceae bacterium]